MLCAVQVQYLNQQNDYVSDKSDQKDAQVAITTSILARTPLRAAYTLCQNLVSL